MIFGPTSGFSYEYCMIQSVTSTLALGGEGMWLGHQRKSGIGFVARYNTPTVVSLYFVFKPLDLHILKTDGRSSFGY